MKQKWIYTAASGIAVILSIIPFVFSKPDNSACFIERDMSIPAFYAVMLILSLAILVAYIFSMEKKYIWVLLSFVSACIVNMGYLAFSLSSNVSEALLANRIAYFGNVYMLLFLSITLANVSAIKYSRAFIVFLFIVSTIMYLFAATQGYLDIFYKEVEFTIEGGYVRLIKDYGPMHTVYTVYILSYLLLIMVTMVYAVIKKKTHSPFYSAAIGAIGFINVAIWLTEQFTDNHIEFLSLSYVLNGVLLFAIYRRLIRDGLLDSYTITLKIKTDEYPEKVFDFVMENRDKDEIHLERQMLGLANLSESRLREIIKKLPAENRLTERETDVAVLLLKDLKRKDMASTLFVSEDTIKTHTSHIFGKLNVSNRRTLQKMAEDVLDGKN